MQPNAKHSISDLAEIADTALAFSLRDAVVILIDALYDLADGKPVQDISDVIEVVREVALAHQVASEQLRRRPKKLPNIIFSILLPIVSLLYQPRYVAAAATAGVALVGSVKQSIAQTTLSRATQPQQFQHSVVGRHADHGRQTRHTLTHIRNGQFDGVAMPDD